MNIVNLPTIIEDEQIDSWLVTAFEGGSNYWCTGVRVKYDDYKGTKYASHCVSKGGIVIVEGKHEITKQKMLDALVWMKKNKYTKMVDRLLDPGAYDAIDADVIFQVACFGKVIYG
tara:strand:+ start:810 stop:1157 length:348 start_codon:yes stop_codon:yes gene_type:complete